MKSVPGTRGFWARLGLTALNLALVVIAGGFAAAALVRYSPGFDVDENTWNPRIGAATEEAMHAARRRENALPRFYVNYLRAALHGDFGESDSLKAPVAELLGERAPVTMRLIGFGTAGGMALGALLAWIAVWPRGAAGPMFGVTTSGLLLAIPPAVLGLYFFFEEAPLWIAVALAVAPRVFGTARAVLADLHGSPALVAARARGVGPARLAVRYVAGAALPQWIALFGVTVVLAFGSIIPIEALCDVPGIGQLAWKAALARDLPLLCGLALIITFAVACAQSLGELAGWER
ncbi:MAG: ABC transporter permease subunit, partial [Acidobacteriota bacterium]|nr:ABC transporter permease subunit [Acidobacteriota bacterium]